MAINPSLPNDVGAKTKALTDRLRAMANDPTRQHSDQDIHDAAISGLIEIVAELEAAAVRAKRQADHDDIAFHSAGGGR